MTLHRPRKTVALATCVLLLSLLSAVSAAAQTTVTIAIPGGPAHPFYVGLMAAIPAFEAAHPDIKVNVETAFTPDKLQVAIAAGLSPDVYQEGVGNVIPNSIAGLFTPLDAYYERYGITPENEFIPAVLPLLEWEGKTYAMHWLADVNFAFARNEQKLAAAGLDPSEELTYIDEVEEAVRKITRVNSDGSLEQIGLVPWAAGAPSNALLTWGLAFGGSFYDLETGRLTSDHPGNIAALEWMYSFIERGWWQPGAPDNFVFASDVIAMGLVWPEAVGVLRDLNPDATYALGPGAPLSWRRGPCRFPSSSTPTWATTSTTPSPSPLPQSLRKSNSSA